MFEMDLGRRLATLGSRLLLQFLDDIDVASDYGEVVADYYCCVMYYNMDGCD
jgi:hypothetical protein